MSSLPQRHTKTRAFVAIVLLGTGFSCPSEEIDLPAQNVTLGFGNLSSEMQFSQFDNGQGTLNYVTLDWFVIASSQFGVENSGTKLSTLSDRFTNTFTVSYAGKAGCYFYCTNISVPAHTQEQIIDAMPSDSQTIHPHFTTVAASTNFIGKATLPIDVAWMGQDTSSCSGTGCSTSSVGPANYSFAYTVAITYYYTPYSSFFLNAKLDLTNNAIDLTWGARKGSNYVIEVSDVLPSTTWVPISTNTASSTNGSATLSLYSLSASNLFIRARLAN